MSIAGTIRRAGPYATDGVQVDFSFAFKVLNEEDVLVVTTEDGADTDLVYGSDYTVALNADQDSSPGGTITVTVAPDGPELSIISDADIVQPTVFTNTGGFYPRVLNDALDRLTIFIQQIVEKLTRVPLLPLGTRPVGKFPVVLSDGTFGWSDGTGADGGLRADLAAVGGPGLLGFKQSGTGTADSDALTKLRERLSINDFAGADPTGTGDSTAAITAAIVEAAASGRALHVDGVYRYTAQIIVPAGVQFIGNGHIVSDKKQRSDSCFLKDYDSAAAGGFLFSGSDCSTMGVQYDSLAGRTGGLVQVTGERWNAPSIAATNAGSFGIWIGATETTHTINANCWYVGVARTLGCGTYGFLVDNTSTPPAGEEATWPAGLPDCNAGFLGFLDTRQNGTGWKFGNTIDNTAVQILTDDNTGRGGVFGTYARDNRIFKHYSEGNGLGDLIEVEAYQNSINYPSRARTTTSGWVNDALHVARVNYDAKTAAFTTGESVTGGTSGATGAILRIVNTDATTGYLMLTDVVGSFEDNETITDGAAGSATVNGPESFNPSNSVGGHNSSVGSSPGVDTSPEYTDEELNIVSSTIPRLRFTGTQDGLPGEIRMERDGVSGTKFIFATRETGNIPTDKVEITEDGYLNVVKSTRGVKVNGTRVMAARDTGWTAMTGTGSKAGLAAAAAGTASATYVQAELQGALNRIAALEARLKSYDDALTAHGLIGP
jgi:hypothetical protein